MQENYQFQEDTNAIAEAGELDPGYAVRVNGQSVVVEMGRSRDRRIGADAYEGRAQTVSQLAQEPAYYVGLDENGVLVRVVSISAEDRKVVGSLTGGWVAEGLTITRASLKDLAKYVGAARKIHDAKTKKAEDPAAPTEPASTEPVTAGNEPDPQQDPLAA